MVIILSLLLLILMQVTVSAAEPVAVAFEADTLKHSEITVSRVIKQSDRTTYVILDANIVKSYDIYSLLDQIPNIRHDNITGQITVNGREEVAFVMDNVEISRQELLALSPDQVKSISIIHAPKGKYVSRGVKYVIEVRRKKENGFLTNVRNSLFVVPENERVLANEQPGIQMQYMRNRFNLNAGYFFGDILWGYDIYDKKRFPDGTEYVSDISHEKGSEERTSTSSHSAYLRASYDFNDRHSISFSTSYLRNDINTTNSTYLLNPTTGMSFGDVTELGRVEDNVASSFTYNASLNDKVAMSLSANWNRISSPERHTYMYNGLAGESIRYSKTKDYSFQNVDFTFDAADNVSLNFGLNNIYNRYRINDGGTAGIGFDRKSIRFDTYGYASWNVRRDLSLRGGISAGYVNDDVTDKFYVAPQLSLTYYPDSFFGMSAVYGIEPSYPTREELDPFSRQTGKNFYVRGNPELPSVSLTHTLLLQMVFWDNLTFMNYFSGSPDWISDYYLQHGNDVISTYSSAKHWCYITGLEYNWDISRNWSWNNSVQMNIVKISHEKSFRREIGLMGESSIQYSAPRLKLFSQLRYSRSLSRVPAIQGFTEGGFDMWDLTVNKQLFKNRLVVSLNYVLPIDWGVRKTQKYEVRTPFYFHYNAMNLGIYDNMVIFRLTYRFGNGRRTKVIDDNTRYDHEETDSRGLL